MKDILDIRAAAPGPMALVTVLMHGDETCGLDVLEAARDPGFAIARGRLVVIAMNPRAHEAPGGPRRHLGVDMNRIWSEGALDADGAEARRIRLLLPLMREAHAILDVHSMPEQERTFMLVSADRPASLGMARLLGEAIPRTLVAPRAPQRGCAMFETDLLAPSVPIVVAECGRHARPEAGEVARAVFLSFLEALMLIEPRAPQRPRVREDAATYEITREVVLRHGPLRLAKPFAGFDPVARGEVFAFDGDLPLVAEEDCVVVLTRKAVSPGDEALTLARRRT